MRLSLRQDVPVAMLSFFTEIPGAEERPEACRIVTSKQHLQRIADLICKELDYWPQPAKEAKGAAKRTKKSRE